MTYTPAEKRAYQQRLLDVYGPVLTDHQRNACRLYLDDDWSYAELAEHLGVTRSGAADLVKRGLGHIELMEQKLGHAKLLAQVQG